MTPEEIERLRALCELAKDDRRPVRQMALGDLRGIAPVVITRLLDENERLRRLVPND